jgi:hypothetical protein
MYISIQGVSGGDGLQWCWLDATYLSSLSHLTATALERAKNAITNKKRKNIAYNYSSLALPEVPVPVTTTYVSGFVYILKS